MKRLIILLAIMVCIARPAAAAIARVNGTTGHGETAATTVAAAAASHTGGNFLAACVNWGDNTNSVSSVTDTAGNTYTRFVGTGISGGSADLWYAKNIAGNASNVVTATYSGSATYRRIIVEQYSGMDTSSPADVSGTGTGTGTSQSTSSATTTQADELIAACYGEWDNATFTAGTNFTVEDKTGNTPPSQVDMAFEDRIVSSIGSYNSTMTVSPSLTYIAIHGTFKAAGGAPPPTLHRLPLLGAGSITLTSVVLPSLHFRYTLIGEIEADVAALDSYPGCDPAAKCLAGIRLCEAGRTTKCVDFYAGDPQFDVWLIRKVGNSAQERFALGTATLHLAPMLADFRPLIP